MNASDSWRQRNIRQILTGSDDSCKKLKANNYDCSIWVLEKISIGVSIYIQNGHFKKQLEGLTNDEE